MRANRLGSALWLALCAWTGFMGWHFAGNLFGILGTPADATMKMAVITGAFAGDLLMWAVVAAVIGVAYGWKGRGD